MDEKIKVKSPRDALQHGKRRGQWQDVSRLTSHRGEGISVRTDESSPTARGFAKNARGTMIKKGWHWEDFVSFSLYRSKVFYQLHVLNYSCLTGCACGVSVWA
jgi:hypothetical protein